MGCGSSHPSLAPVHVSEPVAVALAVVPQQHAGDTPPSNTHTLSSKQEQSTPNLDSQSAPAAQHSAVVNEAVKSSSHAGPGAADSSESHHHHRTSLGLSHAHHESKPNHLSTDQMKTHPDNMLLQHIVEAEHSLAGGHHRSSSRSSRRQSASSMPFPVKCDRNFTHVAKLWCVQCEQHLCVACDTELHAISEAHMSHVRKPVEWQHKRADETDYHQHPKLNNHEASPLHQSVNHSRHSHIHSHSEHSSKQASSLNVSKHNRLNLLTVDQLRHLSPENLELLWHSYNSNNAALMTDHSIHALGRDCVTRLMHEIAVEVKRAHPDATQDVVDNYVMIERQRILPHCVTIEQASNHIQERFKNHMQMAHPQGISRVEFDEGFRSFAHDIFKLPKLSEDEGPCKVM